MHGAIRKLPISNVSADRLGRSGASKACNSKSRPIEDRAGWQDFGDDGASAVQPPSGSQLGAAAQDVHMPHSGCFHGRLSGAVPLLARKSGSGTTISHRSPSVRQSKRTSPLSWLRIIRSITRVPKPCRAGGVTGGPPDSAQRSAICPCSERETTRPERGPWVLTGPRI